MISCVLKRKRGQANYASVIVREWLTCIDHPAANQIFLAGDGEDLSTTDLLRRLLGKALGRPARLLPVPQPLLEFGLKMAGKKDLAQRLCGSCVFQ